MIFLWADVDPLHVTWPLENDQKSFGRGWWNDHMRKSVPLVVIRRPLPRWVFCLSRRLMNCGILFCKCPPENRNQGVEVMLKHRRICNTYTVMETSPLAKNIKSLYQVYQQFSLNLCSRPWWKHRLKTYRHFWRLLQPASTPAHPTMPAATLTLTEMIPHGSEAFIELLSATVAWLSPKLQWVICSPCWPSWLHSSSQ